jgi:predicted kinase
MAKSIIILSGPVGAGKSTVARELVKLSKGPVACIEGDTFWSFIAHETPGASRQKNFRTIMAAMISAALPFALAEHEVIVDFSIPPWFLETALKIAKLRDIPLDYIVLLPSEAVCAARARARTEGTIADYADYHDLYKTFAGAERYAISDDKSSAAKLASRVRKGIDAEIFRVSK